MWRYDPTLLQNYKRPLGGKPWNLLTTYDDYLTSNCNEFVHEQFRKAVSDVYSELTDQQQKDQFWDVYCAIDRVKKLVPGEHKITWALPVPGARMEVAALELALSSRLSSVQGAATDETENCFEGKIVEFWRDAGGGRYKLQTKDGSSTITSCAECGADYPPLPWWMVFFTKLYQEAHITTTTPDSYFKSPFFEEIAY